MNELGEVIPRKGIGEIQLGESAASLISLLGNPVREGKERHNKSSMDYEGFNLTFTEHGALESIEVYPGTRITYKGIEVFEDDRAWKSLIKDDPNPYHLSGTIILLNLGVSMWEDPNEDRQNKSFVISADSAWDHLKNRFKPYVAATI